MRHNELPERFYRLLYFCPRPEDDERVCIGVLLHDARKTYLDYDDKLEKAHCFAPDYGKESLAFVLETVRDQASKVAVAGKLEQFSPQFALSSPRALSKPIDEHIVNVLRRRYLLKPKPFDRKTREKGLGRRIDEFLSRSLDFEIPLSALHRQATATDLFGDAVVRELPKDLVPRPVSRAVVLDSGLFLMDGVDLHAASGEVFAQKVSRIVHTFWQCKQVQEITGRGKTVKAAAMVFNGDGPSIEDTLKWRRDFAIHEFQHDADVTVQVGSPDQEERLRDTLHTVLPNDRLLPGTGNCP